MRLVRILKANPLPVHEPNPAKAGDLRMLSDRDAEQKVADGLAEYWEVDEPG